MKLASVVLFASCASMLLVAGCAAGGDAGDDFDSGIRLPPGADGGPRSGDGAPIRPDTGPPDAGQDAGICVPSCTMDIQCQTSCPAIRPGTTGANCCDRATNMCFVYSASTCPTPPQDGGMMMAY